MGPPFIIATNPLCEQELSSCAHDASAHTCRTLGSHWIGGGLGVVLVAPAAASSCFVLILLFRSVISRVDSHFNPRLLPVLFKYPTVLLSIFRCCPVGAEATLASADIGYDRSGWVQVARYDTWPRIRWYSFVRFTQGTLSLCVDVIRVPGGSGSSLPFRFSISSVATIPSM